MLKKALIILLLLVLAVVLYAVFYLLFESYWIAALGAVVVLGLGIGLYWIIRGKFFTKEDKTTKNHLARNLSAFREFLRFHRKKIELARGKYTPWMVAFTSGESDFFKRARFVLYEGSPVDRLNIWYRPKEFVVLEWTCATLSKEDLTLFTRIIEQIKLSRSLLPINMVAVLSTLDEATRMEKSQNAAFIQNAKDQISVISDTIKTNVPLYLFIRDLDNIAGYEHFHNGLFSALSGHYVTLGLIHEGRNLTLSSFDLAYRKFMNALSGAKEIIVGSWNSEQHINGGFLFDKQLFLLKDKLFELISLLIDKKSGGNNVFFRGLFFSDALEKERSAAVDYLAPHMVSLGLSVGQVPESERRLLVRRTPSDLPYGIFRNVIRFETGLADKPLGAVIYHKGLLLCSVALIVGVFFTFLSLMKENIGFIHDVRYRYTQLEEKVNAAHLTHESSLESMVSLLSEIKKDYDFIESEESEHFFTIHPAQEEEIRRIYFKTLHESLFQYLYRNVYVNLTVQSYLTDYRKNSLADVTKFLYMVSMFERPESFQKEATIDYILNPLVKVVPEHDETLIQLRALLSDLFDHLDFDYAQTLVQKYSIHKFINPEKLSLNLDEVLLKLIALLSNQKDVTLQLKNSSLLSAGDYRVPYLYTPNGYVFFETHIDGFAAQLISLLQQDNKIDASINAEKIIRRVRFQYYTHYKETWEAFLKQVSLKPPRSLEDIPLVLDTLTNETESPLVGLAQYVGDNTDLGTEEEGGPSVKVTGKDVKLINRLLAPFLPKKVKGVTKLAAKGAAKSLNKKDKEQPDVVLDPSSIVKDSFEPYVAFDNNPLNGTPFPFQTLSDNLKRVSTAVNRLNALPESERAAQVDGALAEILAAQTTLQGQPPRIAEMMSAFLESSRTLVQDIQADVVRKSWESLYGQYSTILESYAPFNAASHNELKSYQLQQLFSNDSDILQFFTSMATSTLPLNPEFVRSEKTFLTLNQFLYKSNLKLPLELSISDLSPDLSRVSLYVNDQLVEFTHGLPVKLIVDWDLLNDNDRIRILAFNDKNIEVYHQERSGVLSMFSLLQEVGKIPLRAMGSPFDFPLDAGHAMKVSLRFPNASARSVLEDIYGLNLPKDIMRPNVVQNVP